ncbi:MAG: hypothetical protein SGCHY_000604 [Lobulomycetales sp.]
MIKNHIASLPEEDRNEAESMIAETGQAPLDVVNELAHKLFTKEPWISTGFVVENCPAGKANAEYLISQKLHFDSVIHLKTESDILSSRIIRDTLLKNARENAQKPAHKADDEDENKEWQDQVRDRVEKDVGSSGDTATFIENTSMPVIEVDSNRYVRAVASELLEKTKEFVENVNSQLSNFNDLEAKHIFVCKSDT